MAIPWDAIQRAVEAGHPDQALVGMPVSLLREILRTRLVETIAPIAAPSALTQGPAA